MARTPKPWYRASKRMWFCTHLDKQTPLNVSDPRDEAGAWEALRALVAGAVREAIVPAAGTEFRGTVRPGTVAHLTSQFLELRAAAVKPATLRSYGQHLDWLAKRWGGIEFARLDVTAVRAGADAEAWSDTHRANVLWTINALLAWAGRPERLPRPPKESRGAESVIPEQVHRRILAETRGDFRQLVQFLWLTGCRPGEATGLTAEALGADPGAVRIRQHKTRHKGRTRTVHLCAEAAQLLGDQRDKYAGAGFLFRGHRGRPFSLQAMTMRFERVSAKVGHRVTSYMYRHTFATRALAAGESDALVAAMLGHATTAMIHKHYSHLSEQGRLLRAAAERLNGPR